ncbi:hypothetical protein PROFUN_08482 [Planoprotostelium fungivorum]|uniref:Phosphatidylinositol-4-phosphate 5-kinase n=1 Tax=Planoprotostelium fungivorum TaxID=1890364 RepID=A0A2P6N1V4_9EUKA|nr:hypothetical protein PROFUN_08482 [Planoprotostelium fungivorum]
MYLVSGMIPRFHFIYRIILHVTNLVLSMQRMSCELVLQVPDQDWLFLQSTAVCAAMTSNQQNIRSELERKFNRGGTISKPEESAPAPIMPPTQPIQAPSMMSRLFGRSEDHPPSPPPTPTRPSIKLSTKSNSLNTNLEPPAHNQTRRLSGSKWGNGNAPPASHAEESSQNAGRGFVKAAADNLNQILVNKQDMVKTSPPPSSPRLEDNSNNTSTNIGNILNAAASANRTQKTVNVGYGITVQQTTVRKPNGSVSIHRNPKSQNDDGHDEPISSVAKATVMLQNLHAARAIHPEGDRPESRPTVSVVGRASEAPPVESTKILMQGALTKLGRFNPDWKLRWFVMTREEKVVKLSYMKTRFDQTPLNSVVVDKDSRVKDVEGMVGFTLSDILERHRPFYLCASDNIERKGWISAINHVIREDRETQDKTFVVTIPSVVSCGSEIYNEPTPDQSKDTSSVVPPMRQLPKPLSHLHTPYRHKRCTINTKRWKNYFAGDQPNPNTKTANVVLIYSSSCTVNSSMIQKLITKKWTPRIAVRSDPETDSILSEDCISQYLAMGAEVVFFTRSKISQLFADVKKILLYSDVGFSTNDVNDTLIFLLEAGKSKRVGVTSDVTCQSDIYQIEHVIKTSFVGTERWHNASEQALMTSSLHFTIIRHNYLMQSFLIDGIRTSGVIELPLQDQTRMSFIDVNDLTDALTRVITDEGTRHYGKIYIFSGPEALSLAEITETLSTVAHKKISYRQVSEKESRSQMINSVGLPEYLADAYLELYRSVDGVDGVGSPESKVVSPDLERVLERRTVLFLQFAAAHHNIFREDYLEYFLLGSAELQSIKNQFDRFRIMGRSVVPQTPSLPKSSDVEKAAFVHCIGVILNDEAIGDALFRGFEKKSPDRLTFKEYAKGVGRLTKGNLTERLHFVWRMYESLGKVDEQKFLECTKSLYRFTNATKVSEEMLKHLFHTISGHQKKITFQMYTEGLLKNTQFLEILGLDGTETGPVRRGGIFFGHENWDLAEALTMGIANSVAMMSREGGFVPEPALVPEEIAEHNLEFGKTVEFPVQRGNTVTSFTDYEPFVFYYLRGLVGINIEAYLTPTNPQTSFSPESLFGTLVEVASTGRSGSFFFKTSDDRYLLKTLPSDEAMLLLRLLPDYFKYLSRNRDALLIRFFGLHRMVYQGKIIYFAVMENIFDTPLPLHERYDLKGSKLDRLVKISPGINPEVALKDLNFNRLIHIGQIQKEFFMSQLERDSKWLEERNICDYSLLVGIHDSKKLPPGSRFLKPLRPSKDRVKVSRWRVALGGVNSVHVQESDPEKGEEVYFFGIIDILTQYDAKKKAEHAIKTLLYYSSAEGGSAISAVPPPQYQDRFVKFMGSIVV